MYSIIINKITYNKLRKPLIRKVLPLLTAVTLVSVFVVSFFKFYPEVPGISRLFSESFTAPAAELNINRALAQDTAGSEHPGNSRETSQNLVFLSGTARVITSSDSPSGFTLLTAPAVLLVLFAACLRKRNNSLKTRMRACRVRSLKFLDPVEQSIRSRADEYDINPVRNFLREIKPVFCQAQSTGFFYGVKGEGL